MRAKIRRFGLSFVFLFCMAVFLVLMQGCQLYAGASMGAPLFDTRKGGFDGRGPIVMGSLTAERQWRDGVAGYCEYAHVSNLNSGWPFNDEPENWVDSFGCGARLRLF